MSEQSTQGRELDTEVAERVMGWRLYSKRRGPGATWVHPAGYHTGEGAWPRYSTDIVAAWEVVEALRPYTTDVIVGTEPGGYEVEVCVTEEAYRIGWRSAIARAETAPLAICRAALEAQRTGEGDR